jgi:phosphoglycerate kinase
MTYTFAKAQGGKIGNSICENDKLDIALDVIKKAKENHVNLVLGTDSVIADKFANDANTKITASGAIPKDGKVLMPVLTAAKHLPRPLKAARRSCGMVLPECLNLIILPVAPKLSLRLSPRLPRQELSPSSEAVIP